MSFKTVQKQMMGQGHSKESAGKILGAAAQKAKHPSPKQQKVLRAQKRKKKPIRKSSDKPTAAAGKFPPKKA
jgi:hypothetical protein